jgi:hypothetical protein
MVRSCCPFAVGRRSLRTGAEQYPQKLGPVMTAVHSVHVSSWKTVYDGAKCMALSDTGERKCKSMNSSKVKNKRQQVKRQCHINPNVVTLAL